MDKSVLVMMAAAAMGAAVGGFYSPQWKFHAGSDFSSVVSARRKSRRAKSVKRSRKKR